MYRKKYSVVCLLLLVLSCLLSACGNGKSEKYDEAISLMDNNNYNEAIEIFTELVDYEDSSTKLLECKYALGQEAIATEEWETAISYFTDLNYNDSNELLAKCEKEKGMHENADYDFLADLEESILKRIATVSTTNHDNTTVVNTELVYVGKYQDATFYDSDLAILAKKYIEGLNIQKAALRKENTYELQIEWQRGLVYRYETLRDLYETYDFLADNTDFIAIYISNCDDQRALLDAYDTLEADINSQTQSEEFTWWLDGNEFYCTLKNNTPYKFSTTFQISFLDSNGIIFDESVDYIENITSGSSYKVSFYVDDPNRIENCIWSNYYDEVIY